MTTIVYKSVGVDMLHPNFSGLFNYKFISASLTSLKLFNDALNYTEFTGTGLSVDINHVPDDGTVTGVVVVSAGVTLQSYTDMSVNAVDFYNRAIANDVAGLYDLVLAGDDTITGSSKADVLVSGDGADIIHGGGGNDGINGGAGNDKLFGDAGRDFITGSGGADQLNGGLGNDRLTGGTGADQFRFTTKLGSGNVDTVKDFSSADLFGLSATIFHDIGTKGQAMNADAFVSVATLAGAMLDGNDRIIYETSTGNLYYDSDGSGLDAAVKFAFLTGAPVADASDFFVI